MYIYCGSLYVYIDTVKHSKFTKIESSRCLSGAGKVGVPSPRGINWTNIL